MKLTGRFQWLCLAFIVAIRAASVDSCYDVPVNYPVSDFIDYPSYKYPSTSHACWNVYHNAEGHGDRVNFRLTTISLDCAYETLEIRDDSNTGAVLASLCGDQSCGNVTSTSERLYIEFRSTRYGDTRGFFARTFTVDLGDWAYKTTTWQGKECFSTSTSSTNTGLVVGVILGLAAFFILAIGFAVCMRYRAMRGRASAQGGHVVVASSCGNPVPPIASTPVPANQGYTQPYTINTAPANPCYTQPYAINTAPAEQGYTQPYTTEPQYTTPMWSTAPGNGDQPPSYEQAAMDKV